MTSKTRGYALMFVTLVLFLMALSIGTLSWSLTANIAETRRVVTTIRTDSGCASVLDLAGRLIEETLTKEPATDPTTLTNMLCKIESCETVNGTELPKWLAPVGTELINFRMVHTGGRAPTTRRIISGRFADRIAVEQSLLVTVSVRDLNTGRVCDATDRYLVPSLPLLSFPMFGMANKTVWQPPLNVRRIKDGPASLIHVNGNTSSTQLTASDFDLPNGQAAGEPKPIDLVKSTTGRVQKLRPPVFVKPVTAQEGVNSALRWLIEQPKSDDSIEMKSMRLANIADIVIIDGDWFDNSDKSQPWPGRQIYSDGFGSGDRPFKAAVAWGGVPDLAAEPPSLYSYYDRTTANTLSASNILSTQAPSVISYGALHRASSCTDDCYEPGGWATDGICGATSSTSTSNRFRGLSACSTDDAGAFLLDGARSGFRDNGETNNIVPININLSALQDALLHSGSKLELGPQLGLPIVGTSKFNGIIYISTSHDNDVDEPISRSHDGEPDGSTQPLCWQGGHGNDSAEACKPADDDYDRDLHGYAMYRLPVGVCGEGTGAPVPGFFPHGQDCSKAIKPNAVRLYNGKFFDAKASPRGLTIATDLPMYVLGDLNRVKVTGTVVSPQIKMALAADRITFLSGTWRDDSRPFVRNHDSHSGFYAATRPAPGAMIVEASLITGVPRRGADTHDIADVFRAIQTSSTPVQKTFDDNFFILRGHVVVGFNSQWQRDDSTDRRVNRGLRWLPDYHLENPGFQPPGIPLVTLAPTGRWRQR